MPLSQPGLILKSYLPCSLVLRPLHSDLDPIKVTSSFQPCAQLLHRVWLSATLWTVAHQAALSITFFQLNYTLITFVTMVLSPVLAENKQSRNMSWTNLKFEVFHPTSDKLLFLKCKYDFGQRLGIRFGVWGHAGWSWVKVKKEALFLESGLEDISTEGVLSESILYLIWFSRKIHLECSNTSYYFQLLWTTEPILRWVNVSLNVQLTESLPFLMEGAWNLLAVSIFACAQMSWVTFIVPLLLLIISKVS